MAGKNRGYRVEIGEVEQVLLSHPAIKDAAVRAWDRQSGEKYLAAYVVAREQNRLGVSGLVEFMRTQLPDYMIPAGFLFLNSLPLTNGKIDRSALPPPERTRPDLGNPYVASRNESESAIVRIWEELLEISPIGIHDDFFDLGGHSLLATQAVSRVLQAFNVEIPLRAVVREPNGGRARGANRPRPSKLVLRG